MTSVCSPQLALVGDRSAHVRAHMRIPDVLAALRHREGLNLDAYWIPTEQAEHSRLDQFDGIWVVPGSPYRSETGALAAIRIAREHRIPFLGTCGGFQHAMLEYARHVCGLTAAAHAENDPAGEDFIVVPLACSLVGHEGTVLLTPDSLAARALGDERSLERYHCSFALNPRHQDTLTAHGLRFTGRGPDDTSRIAELPEHPFYMATLFQPELAGDGSCAHPLIVAFAAAVLHHKSTHTGTSPQEETEPSA